MAQEEAKHLSMGKKAQIKRDKIETAEKERRHFKKSLAVESEPWLYFWRKWEFWYYTVVSILIVIGISLMIFRQMQLGTKAIIHTSMGDITIELYKRDAPKTVNNFARLARKNYYNNLLWHRVIKGFMIQTGDPSGDGTGGVSADGGTFADEINATYLGLDQEIVSQTPTVYNQLSTDDKTTYGSMTVKAYYEAKGYTYSDTLKSHKMLAGSVAMANSGPDTNGSQFFIVTDKAQPHLDGQHTVFGQVTAGMDIVQKISQVPTDSNDKPSDPVYVTSIEIR